MVQFLYNGHSIITKASVHNVRKNVIFKVDTGSQITLMSSYDLSLMTGYAKDKIDDFISKKKGLPFHGVGGAEVLAVPCSIRNVTIGEENTTNNIQLDTFNTFVTVKGVEVSLLGMDFLEACVSDMVFGKMRITKFHDSMFLEKFKNNCGGIKINEISELSNKRSISDLLSKVEGM